MRDQSLELARLEEPDITVIDVGSGTGFTTQGIVQYVPAERVTCIDQSPHQMAKAKEKPDLQGCTFEIGDAEQIPVASNTFDRYISAGSIEYWPNPERGIEEAFRVIKPGGRAVLIGPLEPGSWISRFFAELWMLFPKEVEYREWFERAGFQEIESVYVQPHWHRSKKNQYGIAIAGIKPDTVTSPPRADRAVLTETAEKMTLGRQLKMIGRVLLGSIGGFIFIPIALLGYLYSALSGNPTRKSLNRHQIIALLIILAIIVVMSIWLS
jgi:MPBQ/MSBQ methyltransferase